MAGQPRGFNREREIDQHYLTSINNRSSGGQTTATAKSSDRTKQYLKTKNGIFNGAYGNIEDSLSIATGILDITDDSTGAIVIRRVLHINPETGVTDTLVGIETDVEPPLLPVLPMITHLVIDVS